MAASYLFAGKPQLSDITHDKTEMTLCTYSNTESPHQSYSQSVFLLELDSLLPFLIKLVIQFINCFPSIQVFFPLNLHWLLSCWTKTTHTSAAVVNKCLTESKQKKSVFAPRGLWKHFLSAPFHKHSYIDINAMDGCFEKVNKLEITKVKIDINYDTWC